jgi:hypothetical protein
VITRLPKPANPVGMVPGMDFIPERFPRGPGQVPRATIACYAAAMLTAAVAISLGLFGGTARTVAFGVLEAIAGGIAWTAMGTALALLAQIADRR